MISIIICSRTPAINETLKANINATVGLPHEYIIIDNSENKHTIFEAYNIGVTKSQYPYLCFMHDDIEFHTNNWGLLLTKHFEDEQTGAIGIAGSPYQALMPGSWWAGGLINIHIIPWHAKNKAADILSYPKTTQNKNQVVTLDGVWFCIRKKLFNSIKFDETAFGGFHFYDIDISLQIHQSGYKLYCVFDILIEHFSKGDMNANWLENAFILKNRWQKQLPVACIKLDYALQCEAELKTIKELVFVMLQNKLPHKQVYRKGLAELSSFSKGYFYPPILFQLTKYLIGSM